MISVTWEEWCLLNNNNISEVLDVFQSDNALQDLSSTLMDYLHMLFVNTPIPKEYFEQSDLANSSQQYTTYTRSLYGYPACLASKLARVVKTLRHIVESDAKRKDDAFFATYIILQNIIPEIVAEQTKTAVAYLDKLAASYNLDSLMPYSENRFAVVAMLFDYIPENLNSAPSDTVNLLDSYNNQFETFKGSPYEGATVELLKVFIPGEFFINGVSCFSEDPIEMYSKYKRVQLYYGSHLLRSLYTAYERIAKFIMQVQESSKSAILSDSSVSSGSSTPFEISYSTMGKAAYLALLENIRAACYQLRAFCEIREAADFPRGYDEFTADTLAIVLQWVEFMATQYPSMNQVEDFKYLAATVHAYLFLRNSNSTHDVSRSDVTEWLKNYSLPEPHFVMSDGTEYNRAQDRLRIYKRPIIDSGVKIVAQLPYYHSILQYIQDICYVLQQTKSFTVWTSMSVDRPISAIYGTYPYRFTDLRYERFTQGFSSKPFDSSVFNSYHYFTEAVVEKAPSLVELSAVMNQVFEKLNTFYGSRQIEAYALVRSIRRLMELSNSVLYPEKGTWVPKEIIERAALLLPNNSRAKEYYLETNSIAPKTLLQLYYSVQALAEVLTVQSNLSEFYDETSLHNELSYIQKIYLPHICKFDRPILNYLLGLTQVMYEAKIVSIDCENFTKMLKGTVCNVIQSTSASTAPSASKISTTISTVLPTDIKGYELGYYNIYCCASTNGAMKAVITMVLSAYAVLQNIIYNLQTTSMWWMHCRDNKLACELGAVLDLKYLAQMSTIDSGSEAEESRESMDSINSRESMESIEQAPQEESEKAEVTLKSTSKDSAPSNTLGALDVLRKLNLRS